MNIRTKTIIAALVAAQLLAVQAPVRAADSGTNAPAEPPPAAKTEKGAPLPLHTIEGTGGVLITPIAYLVNPGPEKKVFGRPAFSATYVGADDKDVFAFVVTETLWQRVELGWAASRFGLGTFPAAVAKATDNALSVDRADVWLNTLSTRVLVLPENSFKLPLPAVTVGGQLKINSGISSINNQLGGALTGAGYHTDVGADFTLTASKTFAKLGFGRPVILTAGLRVSPAAWEGYVGFGEKYYPTFEGNVVWLPFDRLGLAFEYRQNPDPYSTITVNGTPLLRKEDDWFTAGVAYVFNNHSTVTVGYGHFGGLLNTVNNLGWAIQGKYEF